ncbi:MULTISPECIES: 4-hydroxythreonine-4-phosphate dehydrogenase PdxA [unclassified Tolypothrix]|uniref:4-hydroxythreonine-4-phosphate dehydrogenase PdxA n=1 Tax=unclassified Tolypothrix TaxID=2649714 RepID=UPI0005EABA09|nr:MULTISPECIES: 4-hydroxythreonine-4-phosphate dehydrogenase PdxA [unclassified Tolypothrix]BAY92103.1 4-hydroxythreonine-4-phosphate dehydrogenase [Microchaete diplosiphon NIES-3275]EKF04682.1 4-hydroxythreonine-4-phosphate dehydrogenase [Tolypothrix sp. PCC 7601]MBE9085988.1 4-hydroxythreonine-4-phosphate dehydrogenase PdxA [Tolypothrix sp. LEGE 11397]UYD26085.1 4-hydroxythreonine-4-phosphate dehydrogenase PdxA [Tolypothrix sp. PCC 7712]UYD31676.1 4-hydroxythreonine-4-phosphate dehydrogenas
MYQINQNLVGNSSLENRPRLALTLGDPAGIGPEVILKALADQDIRQNFNVTIVGSLDLLVKTHTKLLRLTDNLVPLANPAELSVIDVPLPQEIQAEILIGRGNQASGAASFAYMEYAIAQTLAGKFDGIVTAPIAKSAWKAAGYNYPGQTELLAEKSGVERFGMLFVARSPYTGWTIRTLLATTHIPLRQVADTLTPQLLSKKLDLLVECLEKDFGIENGKIAIAGLNPHSGEQGQLGTEEIDWLIPWLEQERQNRPNLQLEGPIPPDTMWVKPGQAWYGNSQNQNPADGYLALYHDQGLIPVKLMAFDRAVNTTIGLPFVRTSPDHGTAFDIAGKGIADATSMKAAIELAAELVSQRLAKQFTHP